MHLFRRSSRQVCNRFHRQTSQGPVALKTAKLRTEDPPLCHHGTHTTTNHQRQLANTLLTFPQAHTFIKQQYLASGVCFMKRGVTREKTVGNCNVKLANTASASCKSWSPLPSLTPNLDTKTNANTRVKTAFGCVVSVPSFWRSCTS